MTTRHAFRPSISGALLETRRLLSHGGRAASAHVGGPGHLARQPPPTVTTLVDTAYASFASDYSQARALYYSVFTVPANTAFQDYTAQRVNVLAEQLVATLLVSSSGTTRMRGQADALPSLINRRVNGGSPTSLLSTLRASTPPAGSSASAATALYSLSQDYAIEASRISVINGVSILKNGDFGTKSHKHH